MPILHSIQIIDQNLKREHLRKLPVVLLLSSFLIVCFFTYTSGQAV